MLPKKVLLLTQDPTLIATIRKSVARVYDCALQVISKFGEAADAATDPQVMAVVAHAVTPDDERRLAGLLFDLERGSRRRPLVAVCETSDPYRDLALTRLGVTECLSRPLDLGHIELLLNKFLFETWAVDGAETDVDPFAANYVDTERSFLCRSAAMDRVVQLIQKLANCETNVLLTGETGTGKSCLARLMHQLSSRKAHPFVVLNCGTLPASLLESELFGHCKGAFTGADQSRVGKFEEAANGTLFLDEVDTLSAEAQARLLRIVEERAFEPVGGNETRYVRSRLITASNRSLEQEVANGRFRQDLYFRLAVIQVRVPPLRERRSEVKLLIEHFLNQVGRQLGGPPPVFSPEASAMMENYDWPGNIRELRNVVEHAVVVDTDGLVKLSDLPAFLPKISDQSSEVGDAEEPSSHESPMDQCTLAQLDQQKAQTEAQRILQALRQFNNNRTQAANELGISRAAFYKKLRKYGLLNT